MRKRPTISGIEGESCPDIIEDLRLFKIRGKHFSTIILIRDKVKKIMKSTDIKLMQDKDAIEENNILLKPRFITKYRSMRPVTKKKGKRRKGR